MLVADKELEELAGHFRNFLEVKLPNLQIVLFRFYDPVVFNAMSHLHDKPQLRAMLQPCRAFYWNADNMLHCLRDSLPTAEAHA